MPSRCGADNQRLWILTEPNSAPKLRRDFRSQVLSTLFTFLGGAVLASLVPSALLAQSSSVPAAPAPATQSASSSAHPESDKTEEITSREQATTFKVNVNLMQVRLVVRDENGRPIGNLTQDDFEIFDNRKPQVITHFSAEQRGAPRLRTHVPDTGDPAIAATPTPSAGVEVAEKYVGYLFDDVHLNFGDLARARQAAERYLATLGPTDRAAIFTTSGQTEVDFTDDRGKLHDALFQVQPRPITRTDLRKCFDISYYMADLIVNKHDARATESATQDAWICEYHRDPTMLQAAQILTESTAEQTLEIGKHESHVALTVINDVIRRMSVIPGERNLVIVSPGFLTPEMEQETVAAMDHALRSQVVISSLDARGVYVLDLNGDISNPAPPSAISLGVKQQFASMEASVVSDVLLVLAEGSGGVFFRNSNDMEEGFRRTSETPEYSYLLAFSPQNLRLDGGFHTIKVNLKHPGKFKLQARRGYFAPRRAADPGQQAKQEIEEALFSQDQVHNLPVQLHTQFFKSNDVDAKLTVLAHIDVKKLTLKKVDGRNRNELTVVSALFNGNGSLVQGIEKTITMQIKDETLERRLGSGITLKTSFDVKPGSYLVRLVVRDAEAQVVDAESDAVRIP
jgi:VWFA-related protein